VHCVEYRANLSHLYKMTCPVFRSRFLWLPPERRPCPFPGWSIASNSQVTEKPAASSQWKAGLRPAKYDGSIAWVHPATIARKVSLSTHQTAGPCHVQAGFLDRYIEALDPQHMHFLQVRQSTTSRSIVKELGRPYRQ